MNLTLDDLRPEVAAFALLMERELRANDHKPGWKGCPPGALVDHLREEVDELADAAQTVAMAAGSLTPSSALTVAQRLQWQQHTERLAATVAEEAADVANMALMVADVCGALTLPTDAA